MSDTHSRFASLQRRLLMERSGVERLKMACDMFDAARALMRAGLAEADHSPDLRARLFVRTYGRDFDPATSARIAAHLRRADESTAGQGASLRRGQDR